MTKDIFEQQPILENERVLLRPIQESDFDNLLPFSLHEPEIWKFGLVTAVATVAVGVTVSSFAGVAVLQPAANTTAMVIAASEKIFTFFMTFVLWCFK